MKPMNENVIKANRESGLNLVAVLLGMAFTFFVGVIFAIGIINNFGSIYHLNNGMYLMLGSLIPSLIILIPFFIRVQKRDTILKSLGEKLD